VRILAAILLALIKPGNGSEPKQPSERISGQPDVAQRALGSAANVAHMFGLATTHERIMFMEAKFGTYLVAYNARDSAALVSK